MTEHSGDILHYLPVRRAMNFGVWSVPRRTPARYRPRDRLPGLAPSGRLSLQQGKGTCSGRIPTGLHYGRTGPFRVGVVPADGCRGGEHAAAFPARMACYSPDPEVGWDEWWVGFYGPNIERLVENGLLSRRQPLFRSDGAAESSAVTGRSSRRSKRSGWVSSP